MAQWVKLCTITEAPDEGHAVEAEVDGISVCLARVDGQLAAIDNWCPHRHAPLGQGWIEGGVIVCPWHSWSFNLQTGQSVYPENEKVDVFPLRLEGPDVLIDIE